MVIDWSGPTEMTLSWRFTATTPFEAEEAVTGYALEWVQMKCAAGRGAIPLKVVEVPTSFEEGRMRGVGTLTICLVSEGQILFLAAVGSTVSQEGAGMIICSGRQGAMCLEAGQDMTAPSEDQEMISVAPSGK